MANKTERLAALKNVHETFSTLVWNVTAVSDLNGADEIKILTTISLLKGMSKAARWDEAADSWMLFIANETSTAKPENFGRTLHWAFCQGSIYFASGVDGLI